jgi:hypothetical protein
MNVVFCNGEVEPRTGIVTMVKTVHSKDPEHLASHWTYGADPSKATPWNIDENGEMSSEGKVNEECQDSV